MSRPLRLDPRISRGALRILANETREKLRPGEFCEEDALLMRGVMRGVLRDEHDRHMRVIKPLADPYGSGDPMLQCEDYALVLAETFLKEYHGALTAPSRHGRARYDPHPAITRFALQALEKAQERSLDRWRYAKAPPNDDPLKSATVY